MAQIKSGVALTLDAGKLVNYVNYQAELLKKEATHSLESNSFSFLRSVTIQNFTDQDLHDVTLHFSCVPDSLTIADIHLGVVEHGSRATFVNRFSIFLDPKALYAISDSMAGSIRATLTSSKGKMLAVNAVNFRLCPIEESASQDRVEEILASYVTPNDPFVQEVVKKAADIRKQKYGDPSFSGYLSHDPNRVLEDMDAVFEAVKEVRIRYAIMGSSYEKFFQRIRLPRSVIQDRMGNCLDLSLLFASIYEAIGLHPVILMLKTHAMAGAWLKDDNLASPLEENSQVFLNAASKGYDSFAPVETTLAVDGQDTNFMTAKNQAYQTLEDGKSFVYGLDIAACRANWIRPIPSPRLEKDGSITFTMPSVESSGPELQKVNPEDHRFLPENYTGNKTRYDYWEDKLLDLSLGNRLINLKFRANTVQVMVDDPETYFAFLAKREKVNFAEYSSEELHPEALGVVPSFVHSPQSLQIQNGYAQNTLFGYVKAGPKIDALKSLSRKSNTALEESGCNPLFLTLGLIRWFDTEASATRGTGALYCPVLLLPVTMPRRKVGSSYPLTYDWDSLTLNRTAFEYFRQTFHLDFNRLIELPKTQEGQVDLRLIYNEIRQIIAPMKNWALLEDPSVLSLFSFSHFVMWSDLKNNKDAILKHPIVQSFVSGEEIPSLKETNLSLDDRLNPADCALPLPADSSQIRAVLDAEAGQSFILDGPPGTGKSQTIANMIVNFLAHGKKVLFVAEKEVALDVVKRRLDALSLGQFALEFANLQEPKSKILETYASLLRRGPTDSDERYEEVSKNIQERRKSLNQTLGELHGRKEFFRSPYEAILLSLSTPEVVPSYSFSYDFLIGLDENKNQTIEEALHDVAESAASFGGYRASPFVGFESRDYSMAYRSAVKDELDHLLPLVKQLELDGYNLCHKKGELPESKANLSAYATALTLLREGTPLWNECLEDPSFLSHEKEIRAAFAAEKEILETKEKLLLSYQDGILSLSGESLKSEWEKAEAMSFFARHKAKKALQNRLKPYAKTKDAYRKDGLTTTIDLLCLYEAKLQERSRLDPYAVFVLRRHPFNRFADAEEWSASFEATLGLAKAIASMTFYPEKQKSFVASLLDFDQGSLFANLPSKFLSDWEQYQKAKESLEKLYTFRLDEYPDDPSYFALLGGKLRDALGAIGRLAEWSSLLAKLDTLSSLLPLEFLAPYLQGKVKEKDLGSYYEHSVASSILSYSLAKNGLGRLSHNDVEKEVALYQKDIAEYTGLVLEETAAKVSSAIPQGAENFAPSTAAHELAKLAKNGGRGVSLRTIFQNYAPLIQNLTPCFMMSPLTVAQYLDYGTYHFDVVIFDEASQIPTSEAVGAIARAKSVIIAGDEEQMPPTSFFTSSIGANDDDGFASFASLQEDLESLLDDAIVLGLPRRHLLWHYRSRHESLIAFSNNRFYENSLLTFPSPKDEKHSVTFRNVKGTYERGRGTNRQEAKEVVKEILKRLQSKDLRSRSIGVVTFNEAQQNLIEDMLDKELAQHPDLPLEPGGEKIFVKNLENVQGDERDVILFSVTYGPDKNGTFSLNFGPLSLQKGERRLNVAVSRSREEMVVFASIEPEEIRAERAKNEGAAMLRDFLTYAKYGIDRLTKNAFHETADADRGVGPYLAEDLRHLGYIVQESLGESTFKIDVAVALPEDPDHYVLGILCDNASFASTPCVDRHVNEPRVLERLGWRLFRLYSVEYLDHKEELLKEIVQAINESKQNPEATSSLIHQPTPLFVKKTLVVAKNSLPYTKGEYQAPKDGSEDDLRVFLYDVILHEQPISRDLLNLRLREAKQLTRIGSKVKDSMDRALGQLIPNQIKTFLQGTTTFYATNHWDEQSYRNYRLDETNSSGRLMTDIPFAEISNCAADILEEQGSMSLDDLAKQVSLRFGYMTLNATRKAYLLKAIRASDCKRNRIYFNGDMVSLSH